MTSRLGPQAVVRSKFVNSHIPERAVVFEPVVARTEDDPNAAPDPRLTRPLRLLPAPEPIAVALAEVPDGPPPNMVWRRVTYRFVKASGPERIAAEWWTVPRKAPAHRASDRGGPDAGARNRASTRKAASPAIISSPRTMAAAASGFSAKACSGSRREPRWFLHGFFS